jgi:hypothetical protein
MDDTPDRTGGRTHDVAPARWHISDIDFGKVESHLVADDERLFFLLASASFVESGSRLYTCNLIDSYRDDPQEAAWLADHWEPEELQHGRALRTYLQSVWPDFDWQGAYAGFFEEYGAACTTDELEPTAALEFAARCVVETGTATYYRMLRDAVREPVLSRILDNIRRDEVRHFKYFYRFFRAHEAREMTPRRRIAAAIARRAIEAGKEDGYCAFRHAYAARYPGRRCDRFAYRAFRRDLHSMARQYYPHRMAAEMFLAPLELRPLARRPLKRALVWGAKLVF